MMPYQMLIINKPLWICGAEHEPFAASSMCSWKNIARIHNSQFGRINCNCYICATCIEVHKPIVDRPIADHPIGLISAFMIAFAHSISAAATTRFAR